MDKTFIRNEVRRFVALRLAQLKRPDSWRAPLAGFCSADDPLFHELKKAVSPTHLLPCDLLPSARTVIAFFIPFGESVAESNQGGRLASRTWAELYVQTNDLIRGLGEHLKSQFGAQGYKTASPPATHNFDPERLVSDWSHRHVAFIAGLGTFGLNNMLITRSGCCGRLGSLVTSLALPADERPESEHCLFRYNSSCALCISRCVGDALFAGGFDRHRCYELCRENEALFTELGKADVCGKCLVGLPCSLTDPVEAMRSKQGKR